MNVRATDGPVRLTYRRLSWPRTWSDDWPDAGELPADLVKAVGAAPGAHLYGVFDGARRARVLGLNDLDTLPADCRATPLMTGSDAESELGPWLLSLNPGDDAPRRVLIDYLRRFQGHGTGILILTQAPEPDLRAHLQGLLKIARDPRGPASVIFRLWDPITAARFLPGLGKSPERLRRLAMTGGGHVLHVMAEADRTEMDLFALSSAPAPQTSRPPFALTPQDAPVLARIAEIGLARSLGEWLARDYASQLPAAASPMTLGRHILQEGQRFAFTRKEDFAYLGHIMAHLGGWFHQSAQYPALMDVLDNQRGPRQAALKARFEEAWRGGHLAVMTEFGPAILSDPAWTPTGDPDADRPPWHTPATIRRVLDRHVPEDRRAALHALWDRAAITARAVGAPEDLGPAIAFLSLFRGLRFYDDPFLGPGSSPATPDAWNALCTATWRTLAR